MSTPAVTVEREGQVGLAHVAHPDGRNALTPALMQELAEALETLDADADVRATVLAGSQKVFAVGADAETGDDAHVAGLWRRLASIDTPLVAAVSGYALGGGWELALLCDMVVASENAEFGQPEVVVGLIPGGGATQRLTRAAGRHRAMELVLTARRIDAHQAERFGLVNRVTGKRDWLDKATDLARVVAVRPPTATRLAKQAVLAAEERGLADGIALERELYGQAMATEDRVEGVQALSEGRRPRFTGR